MNAPVRRTVIVMNTNSAFTRSCTENPFWYRKFEFRKIRRLRRGQTNENFDAADSGRLYVTTMKAKNFQVEIHSIQIDKFENHYNLVSDLSSMQDPTEKYHYPGLVGETLRLELNFTSLLEHVTELIVLGERLSAVAVDKFGAVEKIIWKDNVSLQRIFNRVPPFKYRYLVSFPSDYVPLFSNDTFAIIKTQPSNMQGEHWIMIANSHPKLFFCRLSRATHFPHAAVRINDSTSTIISSQRLRFLCSLCSVSSL